MAGMIFISLLIAGSRNTLMCIYDMIISAASSVASCSTREFEPTLTPKKKYPPWWWVLYLAVGAVCGEPVSYPEHNAVRKPGRVLFFIKLYFCLRLPLLNFSNNWV